MALWIRLIAFVKRSFFYYVGDNILDQFGNPGYIVSTYYSLIDSGGYAKSNCSLLYCVVKNFAI